MIKKVITEYCDACGCRIKDYSSERDIAFDDDFGRYVGSMVFCKDCTISFNEWKKSRDPEDKVDTIRKMCGAYIS